MNNLKVALLAVGIFEIKSSNPQDASLRVTHDPDCPNSPWIVLRRDALSIKWERSMAYFELDDALAAAVRELDNDQEIHEFSVTLPCGNSFLRPGKLPAEQVIASYGWTYVSDFLGHTMIETPLSASPQEARRILLELVEGTSCIAGTIDLVESEAMTSFWCADITMPFHGFLHQDDIRVQFMAAFAMTGINVIAETFDFRNRTPVIQHSADVVDFGAYRKARFRSAA